MQGQKGMDVVLLVKRAIAALETDKSEIRPGIANVLKAMSRLAPQFMLRQLTKMVAVKPGRRGVDVVA